MGVIDFINVYAWKIAAPLFWCIRGVDVLITKKYRSFANKMACIRGKIFLPPYLAEAVT
jgi:hypothetical protein